MERIAGWLERHVRRWFDVNRFIAAGPAVIWGFLPRDASPANFLHHSFRREAWRERSARERLGLCVDFLLWPLVVAVLTVYFTRRNGASVRARTGKGIARQAGEQLWLATTFAVLPPSYYVFELHEAENRHRSREYLYRMELKHALYVFLRKYPGLAADSPSTAELLRDKALFPERCREFGVAAIPVLVTLEQGEVLGAGDPTELPALDLFAKPRSGAGGFGAERWDYRGSGRYEDAAGRILDQDALLEHLKRLSLKKPYVVRPRMDNHPSIADLSTGALSSVRIVTCRAGPGKFEATHAAFRMARGANTVVDNFHMGGIAARVDVKSGVLGRATDMGLSPELGWLEAHPDTRGRIAGRQLPCWKEVVDLALRAHAAFADQVAIGWDVAVLEDGPQLIEGNKSPDLDIIQRTHQAPVGNDRLGELLAYNVRLSLQAKYARSPRA